MKLCASFSSITHQPVLAYLLFLSLLPPSCRVQAACDSPIYCVGPLLDTVQKARLFSDSKTFVDSPTSKPVDQVLLAFKQLGEKPTVEEVRKFYESNFHPAGTEVVDVVPRDWQRQPAILERIEDPLLKAWAASINHRWTRLVRKIDLSTICDQCVSSHLPLKRPFVVAGGRFREAYYWDSYFIVHGLLVSEMFDTAKDVILNMLELVDKYGFMPNGARVYYLNRSQPPLLTQMVSVYYEHTGDLGLVKRALPSLDREHSFWMNSRSVQVGEDIALLNGGTCGDIECAELKLNVYNVNNGAPRPEGYVEDLTTAEHLATNDESVKRKLYKDLASGAESGWDFSSRWMSKPGVRSTLHTSSFIPVDLNSFLYLNERTLARFHQMAENSGPSPTSVKAEYYSNVASQRLKAMAAILWDAENGIWQDWDYERKKRGGIHDDKLSWYSSTLVPLWAGVGDDGNDISKLFNGKVMTETVVKASMKPLTEFLGGVPTSLTETDEQWDFPKAWPPLQYFAINGILKANVPGGKRIAESLIRRWITSNYCGWALTGGLDATKNAMADADPKLDIPGTMFEKYDVEKIGVPAGGGEYDVQEGFGWTNGVVLALLSEFAGPLKLKAPLDCSVEFKMSDFESPKTQNSVKSADPAASQYESPKSQKSVESNASTAFQHESPESQKSVKFADSAVTQNKVSGHSAPVVVSASAAGLCLLGVGVRKMRK